MSLTCAYSNLLPDRDWETNREKFFKDAGIYEYEGKLIQFVTDLSSFTEKGTGFKPKVFVLDNDPGFREEPEFKFVNYIKEIEKKYIDRFQKTH